MGEITRRQHAGRSVGSVALLVALRWCGARADEVEWIFAEASDSSANPRHLRSPPDRVGPSPMAILKCEAVPAPEPVIPGNASEPCVSRMEFEVTACDFDNRQRVEWKYGEGDSAATCETPLPDGESTDCDHVAWYSGEGIAIVVIAVLGAAACVCFWVALSRYKRSRTVRLGQPEFLMTFVVGVGITCLSALTLVGENNDFACALRLWVWSAGFDLAFGALALKLWRALSVVESSLKFNRVKLTTRKVQVMLAIILIGDAGLLVSWTASFGGVHCKSGHEMVAGAFIERISCISCCHGHFFAWVGFKAILVSFCCYMSFRTRKLQNFMAESGAIAMATYNLSVAALLVAAVIWADANPQVRTTAEAVAIVLAGVGALCTILAPKLLKAKQELEGKAVVGPSAIGPGQAIVVSSSSCDGLCAGDTTSGVSVLSAGPRQQRGNGGGDVGPAPVATVTGGGGRGRKLSRMGSGVRNNLTASMFGRSLSSTPDVCPSFEGSPPPSENENNSKPLHEVLPPRRQSPRAVVDLAGLMSAKSAPGGGGHFSTTTRGDGKGLITPDPTGFWTPPRRVRRTRSSAEVSSRSVDGMAAAAAAAGEAQKNRLLGQNARGAGKGHSSVFSMLGDRRYSNASNSKPPASVASGSSRTSRHSRASRASRASSRGKQSTRSNKSSAFSRGSRSSFGSDSVRSNSGGWSDQMLVAINGYGFSAGGSKHGGGGGNGGHRKPKSTGGGGGVGGRRAGSGRWSASGSINRGTSRERSASMGSSNAQGRRGSAANSLVMHPDAGTALHCPHCHKEVAGCGFKGCSGSLVRAPSFSDEDGGPDLLSQPAAPPLLDKLGPSSLGTVNGGGAYHNDGGRQSGWSGRTWGLGSVGGGGASAAMPLSPTHSTSSQHRSRLRMSFRRAPPPSDQFDNESDSSSMDCDGEEERSALGITSPTSSSAWA